MKIYRNLFTEIASLESLFRAWEEFRKGKQNKPDVQRFERHLEENIFNLHQDLVNKTYKHGPCRSFHIQDPKQRLIHKATVRDRVLHHAIFAKLNPIFEPTFISHSFSCQVGKGTHKGVEAATKMLRQASRNGTKPCFVLKGDIKKFFQSINHSRLLEILARKVKDQNALRLLREVVNTSMETGSERERERETCGLSIGNLTSQLFANIYLNELDQFVKHELKIRHYARYTDDFLVVDSNQECLISLVPKIKNFLESKLDLKPHPQKTAIRKFSQGIDFLGYIIFPKYRLLRTKTKRRIFKKLKHRIEEYQSGRITKQSLNQSLQSYLGVLSHANAYKLTNELKNIYFFEGGGRDE